MVSPGSKLAWRETNLQAEVPVQHLSSEATSPVRLELPLGQPTENRK